MRILLVAMVAFTAASGAASALSWGEPVALVLDAAPAPPTIPPAPPAADALAQAAPPSAPGPALAASAAAVAAPPVSRAPLERLERVPTLLLLPDGALAIPASALESGASVAPLEYLRIATPSVGPVASAPAPETLAPRAVPEPSRVPVAAREQPAPASAVAGESTTLSPPPSTSRAAAAAVAGGLAAGAALLGIALYHRIRPHSALENETRKQIFDAVCAQPGLGVHEVAKLAGVSYSTATYHLERLVSASMLVMTPDGNKLCYYKNGGAFTESERRILPLVKNDEAARLFEAILDSPGTYRAALAERLGVTATTINWHLRRLRDAGLVDETRSGRSACLYARADALRESFVALAAKIGDADPLVAARLRRYAGERANAASA